MWGCLVGCCWVGAVVWVVVGLVVGLWGGGLDVVCVIDGLEG